MSSRKPFDVAVIWVLSVLLVGVLAHAQAAQAPAQAPPLGIISGGDLGFRVERLSGGKPVGSLVVRINGQWVDVEFGVGLRRLTAK